MKKISSICLIAITLLITIGCESSNDNSKPSSGGKTNEIVLVIQGISSEAVITSTIKHFFEQVDTMLTQPENLYSTIIVTKDQFDKTNVYNHHHNILFIKKDTSVAKANVETLEDVWAAPQRVVWINFIEDSSFYKLFNGYKNSIVKMFDDNEIKRTHKILLLNQNYEAKTTIETIFKIEMDIPEGFTMATSDTNFVWLNQRISREKQDLIANIMIWQRPYLSEKQFTIDNIVISRNSVAQKHIFGDDVGNSFMKTSLEYIAPEIQAITDFPTNYAIEMRGLWDMVGDFMGGPFISYTFVHPNTEQLITVEGFLYNPNREKRIALRQLQSVIKNVRIIDPQQIKETK